MTEVMTKVGEMLKELERVGDVDVYTFNGKTFVDIHDGYMDERELVNEELVHELFRVVEPFIIKELYGGGEYKIGDVVLRLEQDTANE